MKTDMETRYTQTLARLLLKADRSYCKITEIERDGFHITIGDAWFYFPMTVRGMDNTECSYIFTQLDRAFDSISSQLDSVSETN